MLLILVAILLSQAGNNPAPVDDLYQARKISDVPAGTPTPDQCSRLRRIAIHYPELVQSQLDALKELCLGQINNARKEGILSCQADKAAACVGSGQISLPLILPAVAWWSWGASLVVALGLGGYVGWRVHN